jgi:small-conductance mechanosensitive channel
MIAYVYLACLLLLSLMRLIIRAVVDFIGRSNAFWLRDAIARERGIAAYRAWVPLERIRPAHIPQEQWEETFAWPADNKPPYPPLSHRIVREAISYVIFVVATAAVLQAFTPFPALTRLAQLIVGLAVSAPPLFIIVVAATLYGFVKWRGRSPRAKIAGSTAISVSPKIDDR